MKVPRKNTLIELIELKLNNFKDTFNDALDSYSNYNDVIEDQNKELQASLSEAHKSNDDLNIIFFAFQNEARKNKNLNTINLCEEHARKNKKEYQNSIEFFSQLFALYKYQRWLIDRSIEIKDFHNEANEDLAGRKKLEFTVTRRVLTIKLLLEEAGKDILFGQKGVNKVKISGFINFLISNETDTKTDNASLYKKVKNIWDHLENTSIDNLQYLVLQFESIGLSNIVSRLQQILKSKESKEK